MLNWQVIFVPHLLVVVAWLVLCHLQIGPRERGNDLSAHAPEKSLHSPSDDNSKAA
jgi:hypothetical protein